MTTPSTRTKRIAATAILLVAAVPVVGVTAHILGGGTGPTAHPVARPSAEPAQPHPTPSPAASAVVAASTGPAMPDTIDTAYTVKRVLPVDGPMHFGDWYWDEKDVPPGPLVITVDLKAETLSVFRDGYEIGTAVILYGMGTTPTPLGTFPITQKDADHHSNVYGGAPMPYMLRMTNDGVSIHGSDVRPGFATHGCVGVPTKFAKKLFGEARLGDRVIVTDGKMLDISRATTMG